MSRIVNRATDQANSISKFCNIIDRYKSYENIFYRGQDAKYASITSSVSRDTFSPYEHNIYHDTINIKPNEFDKLKYPIERLAKLQHYGFPTRLIDVTIDPLVALYFAVQDTDTVDDALVFVYIQNSEELHSKHIRLLSLLATLKEYEIEIIQREYQTIYNEKVSRTEILQLAPKTVFINYTKGLEQSNTRLLNQSGTFAICGNKTSNGEIQPELIPLDHVPPITTIKIPYAFKTTIKQELEQSGINQTHIYPELESVSRYIRGKYSNMGPEEFSIEDAYEIVNETPTFAGPAKRVSLKIVLKQSLQREHIKSIAIHNFEKYKLEYDVIYMYIATNKGNCDKANWILSAQWISNRLDAKFRPIPIGELEDDGYYWNSNDSYCIIDEFYHADNKNDFGKFIPTIPLNPTPLIVNFNLNIVSTSDKKMKVNGTTNLYDKAKISLRIYNPLGEQILTDETIVEDGTFSFKSLATQRKSLKPGTYTVEIFVALPSTQHEEFKNKAGIEYENLGGPYIVREGLLGPTIVYKQKFSI
ncbi:FRG domain-containing protein [Bacillus tropicus]|uniref:FRG domain-containing protein n=1 Tax=Bacillus tropicus TaxID=2026188 RepID=UPI0023B1A857|nr:FRG domain-containing protein [Bacillus tropicus]MDE7552296.1 FRG domain-containing protein [Bacillus tropicus]MDE7573771.1 FRG domain-containing protein [Bacillus tropicus]